MGTDGSNPVPSSGESTANRCASTLKLRFLPPGTGTEDHWSVIPSEESLPIAAGRTGGLARAQSIAEEALRAYAEDWRGLLGAETEAVVLTPDYTR